MTRVGVRELKAHLSEYLRKVRQGENLTITDHGKDIAVLQPMPAAENGTRKRLKALEAAGIVTLPKPGSGKPKGLKNPIRLPREQWVSAAILEDRR
jgi:prevent-host-death family protein